MADAIFRNGTLIGGGSGGGSQVVEKTYAEWEALPDSKYSDGVDYEITDWDGEAEVIEPESMMDNLVASDGTEFRFGVTEDGKYGYIVTDSEGADTVIPFSSGGSAEDLYQALQYSGLVTEDMSYEEMLEVLAAEYPAIFTLYNGSLASGYSVSNKITNNDGTNATNSQNCSVSGFTFKAQDYNGWGKNRVYMCVNPQIDLTPYKKIDVEVEISTQSGTGLLYLGVCSSMYSSALTAQKTTTATTVVTLDVSSLTGSYYFTAYAFSSDSGAGIIQGKIKRIEFSA